MDDTIAAIATAPGAAAIGIVRISGPASFEIAHRVFHGRGRVHPEHDASGVLHGRIKDPSGRSDEADIDDVILLSFKKPNSYTGEDVIEIQCHGGTSVVLRILRLVLAMGARQADPGEFTRRAFLNGKMDLVQAEAVADLIAAQTEKAASSAIEQLEGNLSKAFESLYAALLALSSDVETMLDFTEDELPPDYYITTHQRLSAINDQLVTMISTWDEGRILRQGALVVICGRVNAGKSTLLNQLLGVDRAIVSSLPGTTRDTIEELITIDGLPCRLIDTAGLRTSDCIIEQEGVIRTMRYVNKADILLYVIDASLPLTAEDIQFLSDGPGKQVIIILNKNDLGMVIDPLSLPKHHQIIRCMMDDSRSITHLKSMIYNLLTNTSHAIHGAHIGERHYHILSNAKTEIEQALSISTSSNIDPLLIASHARNAADQVGIIIGKKYYTDMLNDIFSRFCIGK